MNRRSHERAGDHKFVSRWGCPSPRLTTPSERPGYPRRGRPIDIATSLADPTRAADALNWRASYDLDAMCRDAWAWQRYLAGRNS